MTDFDSLRAKFEPMRLCPDGFKDNAESRAASWNGCTRADLKQSFIRQVDRAIEWLGLCGQRKTVNPQQTSYALKHEAERWCSNRGYPDGDYISNGALLMAAYLLGFKVQRPTTEHPNFPNAHLNISRHRPSAGEEGSFRYWADHTRVTDDPIGDLISDYRSTKNAPNNFASLDRLRGYLQLRNACPEAIKAAAGAWRRYRKSLETQTLK